MTKCLLNGKPNYVIFGCRSKLLRIFPDFRYNLIIHEDNVEAHDYGFDLSSENVIDISSRGDWYLGVRYLDVTAAVTQVPVPMATSHQPVIRTDVLSPTAYSLRP